MRALCLGVTLVVGCYRPEAADEVPCARNGDCPGEQRCDFSRSPPVCVGELSPSPDAAIADAPPADAAAAVDAPAPPRPPPSFSAAAFAHDSNVPKLTYRLAIPQGLDRFLVVSVHLGTGCNGDTPDVVTVRYGAAALTRIASIVGTPCGTNTTRSEEWQLIAPDPGLHEVTITLANSADTIHSSALAFAGIDQVTPVRATATDSGAGLSAMVTVDSADQDIVVSLIGQGNKIAAPGAGQVPRVVDNVDSRNTLNNAAASTAPGSGPASTMTWTFGGSDEWQMIATSLQP